MINVEIQLLRRLVRAPFFMPAGERQGATGMRRSIIRERTSLDERQFNYTYLT